MKKIVVSIALLLTLGTAACGRSDDANTGANNTVAGSDVALNDEDALGNEGAVDPGNTGADAALGFANSVSGNGF